MGDDKRTEKLEVAVHWLSEASTQFAEMKEEYHAANCIRVARECLAEAKKHGKTPC